MMAPLDSRHHLIELLPQEMDKGNQLTRHVHLQVVFMRSFSDEQKLQLLCNCRAVVYTPQMEHFGIVPLEASAAARPVVACDSGGPVESVSDGLTGLLCEPQPQAFAAAMLRLLVSMQGGWQGCWWGDAGFGGLPGRM